MLHTLNLLALLVISIQYAVSQTATSDFTVGTTNDPWFVTSQPMDPRLVSFSVETNSFQDYFPCKSANNGTPTLTDNLLKQLSNGTGVYAAIRIGGITGNSAFFNQSLVDPFYQGNSFGPGIYQTAANYTNIKWVVMVPLHADLLVQDGIDLAELIVTTMGDSVDRIELGNEPDNIGFPVQDWVNNVTYLATAIGNAIPSQQGKCQINVGGNHPDFTLTSLVTNSGLLSGNGSGAFGVWGQHQYGLSQCGSTPTIDNLLNVSYIESNLLLHQADIALAKQKNLIYDFGESNSISCGGTAGVSDSVAQGLWVIHYVFHTAILGVRRTYFHMGSGGFKGSFSYYNAWSASPAHAAPNTGTVKPMYHALLLLNDAIGSNNATVQRCQMHDVNGTQADPDLYAYKLFESNQWVRTVFVNTHSSDPKTVSVPGSTCHSRVYVGPSIDSRLNATYAGQSYDTPNGLPTGAFEEAIGCNVTIHSSTAVLVFQS